MENLITCSHCGTELPQISDAFCPFCREALGPQDRVHTELKPIDPVRDEMESIQTVAAAMAERDAADAIAGGIVRSGKTDQSEPHPCPMCGHTVNAYDRQCVNCGETNFEHPTPWVIETPRATLHPVRGVVWAAVWGSPFAASIMLAINYARLGRPTAKWCILLVGAAATAALFALSFAVPDMPRAVTFFPQLIVVYSVAQVLQGRLIRKHAVQGGRVASAWKSVGIGFVSGIALFAVILGVSFAVQDSYGTVVKFDKDEIYYSGDATEDDARKLAKFLKEVRIFGGSGAAARLQSSSGRVTISFIVDPDTWDDPKATESFREIFSQLDASAFPRPLTIQLCDEYFKPQTTIVVQ